MPTNPTRLRNWAEVVRSTSPLSEYQQTTVSNMLDYCAKRFEEHEDEVKRLRRALHRFARPTHDGQWRCPICDQVVTAGFAHWYDCEVGIALTPQEPMSDLDEQAAQSTIREPRWGDYA